MQAVEVRGVGYRVATGLFSRPRWLLRDIAFAVPEGGALALIGANGAGKTTLLKTLCGTLLPHAGEALLFGRPAAQPAARARLGFMPERAPFAPVLRAGEIMLQQAALAGLRGAVAHRAVQAGLARVGLARARMQASGTFSKGMLQRLALARALVGGPRLLLLDEPMSGLDPEGRMQVRDLLLEQRKHGTTLLFSSHDPADVALLADAVVVMNGGRIVRQGPPKEVLEGALNGGIEIIADGAIDAAALRACLPACRITPCARHTLFAVADQSDADRVIDFVRQGGGHVVGISRRPGPGAEASRA